MLKGSCDESQPIGRDYWNIDDILAEEEPIPVEFKQECKGLSYLDQSASVGASKAQIKQMKETQKNVILKSG